jgi:hypothetical protein
MIPTARGWQESLHNRAAQLAVAPEPAPRRLVGYSDGRRAGPVNLIVRRL